ncbi:MAG: type II toxin-antitoxin system RelE/ParE family toxin [Clostridia bacterium]|nr:type II toxin-antitoxin system RelE/ParE family toxin [Clostridia bacterium]
MEYKIKISEIFVEQITEVLNYMDITLNELNASNKIRKKLMESFNRIKRFPKSYPQIGKKDRFNRSYRKIIIYNYVILYTIIEEDKTVFISNMYYHRRDYLN